MSMVQTLVAGKVKTDVRKPVKADDSVDQLVDPLVTVKKPLSDELGDPLVKGPQAEAEVVQPPPEPLLQEISDPLVEVEKTLTKQLTDPLEQEKVPKAPPEVPAPVKPLVEAMAKEEVTQPEPEVEQPIELVEKVVEQPDSVVAKTLDEQVVQPIVQVEEALAEVEQDATSTSESSVLAKVAAPLAQLKKVGSEGVDESSVGGSEQGDKALAKQAKKEVEQEEDGGRRAGKRGNPLKNIPIERLAQYKAAGVTELELLAIAEYADRPTLTIDGMSLDRSPVSKEDMAMLATARRGLDKLAVLFKPGAGQPHGGAEVTAAPGTAPASGGATAPAEAQSQVVRLQHPFTFSANSSALSGLHGKGGSLDKGFLSPSAPAPDPAHLLGFQGMSDGMPVLSMGQVPHDNEMVYTPPIPMKVHSVPVTGDPAMSEILTAKGDGLTVRLAGVTPETGKATPKTGLNQPAPLDEAIARGDEAEVESALTVIEQEQGTTEGGESGLVTLEHAYPFAINRDALAGLHGQGQGVLEKGFMSSGIAPEASRLMRFRGLDGGFPVAQTASVPQDGELVYAPPIPVKVRAGTGDGKGLEKGGNGILARINGGKQEAASAKGTGSTGSTTTAVSTTAVAPEAAPILDASKPEMMGDSKLDRRDPIAMAMRKRALGS